MAMVLTEIHFQKRTSSDMVCAFILLFISKLKICSELPDLSAITLLVGFIIAESAVIGRRVGLSGSAMSMITTYTIVHKREQKKKRKSTTRLQSVVFIATYLCSLAQLLSDANVLVTFHRERRETDAGGIDAEVLELRRERTQKKKI